MLLQPVNNNLQGILEFLGMDPGDTSPTLTNIGDYFPFSDLSNPLDTDLTEIVNELNAQIGDRDYSTEALGAVSGLVKGQNLTESLEAIALAVADATTLRIIERLETDLLAGIEHTIPGGNEYTIDGTNQGSNMTVYWRQGIKSPGTLATGDHYEETSTTSIKPFSTIRAGDHIQYEITS